MCSLSYLPSPPLAESSEEKWVSELRGAPCACVQPPLAPGMGLGPGSGSWPVRGLNSFSTLCPRPTEKGRDLLSYPLEKSQN